MRVSKEFKFHAAHRDTEAIDACGRLHGHTYRLVIAVDGLMMNQQRMLLHGDLIKDAYRDLIEPHVEHQYLNETLPCNPTMENIVRWALRLLSERLRGAAPGNRLHVTVRLWETPTMYAEERG